MTRKARYIKQEELHLIKPKPYVECPYCKDRIEIGDTKGKFRCPTCGWDLDTKDKICHN